MKYFISLFVVGLFAGGFMALAASDIGGNAFQMPELASQTNPPANSQKIWMKTDHFLYLKNSAGTDKKLLTSPVDISTGDVTGTLPLANGGTGQTSFSSGALSSNGSALTSGTLSVANGGTSLATLTANNVILGNGTSAPSFVAPSTSGNVLTSNGTTWTSAAASGGSPNAVTAISAAGTTQGTCTQLVGTNTIQEVTTAAANSGVCLPTAAAGNFNEVVNRGASALKVYPFAGGSQTVNSQSANTAFTVLAKNSVIFRCVSATNWYTSNSFQGNTQINTTDASSALVITAASIANASLANMAQSTIKGRAAGAGTGAPTDLTATQATAILNNYVGDSGAGGTAGLVKAPAAGDGSGLIKLLGADGNWKIGQTTVSGYSFGYSPSFSNFNGNQFAPNFSATNAPGCVTPGPGNLIYVCAQGADNDVYVYSPDPQNGFNVGQFDTSDSGTVNQVVWAGKYAYVVGQTGGGAGFLRVFDISKPTDGVSKSVVTVGSTSFGGVAIQGQYAYVTDTTNATLRIYDISVPTSTPVAKGTLGVGNLVRPIKVAGKYAYMAYGAVGAGVAGVYVADISNPASPAAAFGSPNSGLGLNARDLDISGNGDLIYEINDQVLEIFRISFNSIQTVGSYNMTTGGAGTRVLYLGHNLAITDGTNLKFLDVFGYSTPTQVGSNVSLGGAGVAATGIGVLGRFLYAVGGTSGAGTNYIRGYELPSEWVPLMEAGNVSTTGLQAFGQVQLGEVTTSGMVAVGRNLSVSGDSFFQGMAGFNNLNYTWPSARGAAGTALTEDGAGNLSWASSTDWANPGTIGSTTPNTGVFSVLSIKDGGSTKIASFDTTSLTANQSYIFPDQSGGLLTLFPNSISSTGNSFVCGGQYYADTSGGAVDGTLPAPVQPCQIWIKDSGFSAGTNNLSIIQNAAEKIDGTAATYVISSNGGAVILDSDGTDWFIYGQAHAPSTGGGAPIITGSYNSVVSGSLTSQIIGAGYATSTITPGNIGGGNFCSGGCVCIGAPVVTLIDCGTSSTCAAPSTIATVTLTNTGTLYSAAASGSIAAGNFWQMQVTANSCGSYNLQMAAQ